MCLRTAATLFADSWQRYTVSVCNAGMSTASCAICSCSCCTFGPASKAPPTPRAAKCSRSHRGFTIWAPMAPSPSASRRPCRDLIQIGFRITTEAFAHTKGDCDAFHHALQWCHNNCTATWIRACIWKVKAEGQPKECALMAV